MVISSEAEGAALEILFRISPSHRVEFLQTIDSLLSSAPRRSIAGAPGCFEQVGLENTFLWRETWRSKSEAEERLASVPIRTLLGAIEVLGELYRLEILAPGRPQGTGFGNA